MPNGKRMPKKVAPRTKVQVVIISCHYIKDLDIRHTILGVCNIATIIKLLNKVLRCVFDDPGSSERTFFIEI